MSLEKDQNEKDQFMFCKPDFLLCKFLLIVEKTNNRKVNGNIEI